MINIDNRLLSMIDENELWLMIQITKRIKADKISFPSNKTLCEDTKWEIKKVQRIKNRLKDKNLICVNPRYRNAGGQTSNFYLVNTNWIGCYTQVGAKDMSHTYIDSMPDNETDRISSFGVSTPTPKEDDRPTPKKGNQEVLINLSINQKESTTTNEPSEREYLGTTSSGDDTFSIYLGQSVATGLPHIEGGVIVSDRHNDLVSKSNEVGVDFDDYKIAMETVCRMNLTRVDRAVRVSGRSREFFIESFTRHCYDTGFEIRHKRKEKGFLDWLDKHADFLREHPEYEADKVEVTKPKTEKASKKLPETNAAPPQYDQSFNEYWEGYNYKGRSESLKMACWLEWQKLDIWEKQVIKRALPVYLANKEETYRKRPDGWLREKDYKEVKLELDHKLNNRWGDIEDELNNLFWNDANQFVATWQAKKRQGYLEELLPQFEIAATQFKNEKLQNRI